MQLHDGSLDEVVAEESVLVEEVTAGSVEVGLAPLLRLAVLVNQTQLVHVVESEGVMKPPVKSAHARHYNF